MWLGLLVIGILVARWYLNRWLEQDTRRMLEDFQKAFPDSCPVCSFARYGRQIGVNDAWPPKPHECPDKVLKARGAHRD